VAAERFGARIGGVIGGLPSTVAIALFFIGWTESPQSAAASTTVIPFFVGMYGPLVVTYVWLGRYFGIVRLILATVSAWLALAIAIAIIADHGTNFAISIVGGLALLATSYIVLKNLLKVGIAARQSRHAKASELATRAILSGSIVGGTVVAARFVGPVLGGAVAAFPAVMFSTMVITRLSQGTEFSNGVMSVLMMSAGVSVPVYVTVVRYVYPTWGLIVGTSIAFAVSLISAYVVFRGIRESESTPGVPLPT
jgi:hypothetical protein